MSSKISIERSIFVGSLALALLLLVSLGGPALAFEEDEDFEEGEDFETGEVVVKLDPASGATIEEINGDYGSTTLETFLGSAGIYLLELPDGSDTESLAEQMEEDERLLYAEPNFIAETPEGDARHRARAESLAREPSDNKYALRALGMSCAREISAGDGATVAVLDTGAQLDHPALRANFEGVRRYDFVDDDTKPADKAYGLDDDHNGLQDELVGHGTHVAGIVDLMAPRVRIMPLRVLNSDGYGNAFVIAEAISFAQRNGADVINLSLSTPGRSDLLQEAIETATENGVIVTAAAGNDDTRVPQYPAAGDWDGEPDGTDGILAVTSVNKYRKKSGFASYGAWVDVAAPGNGIRSAIPRDGYANWSGTSMATPFVAGEAALIRSDGVAPSLSPEDLEVLIRATARPLDALNPTYAGMLGSGEANAGASLDRLRPGICW